MDELGSIVVVVLLGILGIMLVVRLVKGTSRMIDKEQKPAPGAAKSCPFCFADDLDSRATFCKHCGQKLSGQTAA